jgi:hypothetical protein
VIGNKVGGGSATTGAAVGAALGGTVGAVKGCREDGGCGATNVNRRQYYDERAGRTMTRVAVVTTGKTAAPVKSGAA